MQKSIIYVGDSIADTQRINWLIDKLSKDLDVTITQTISIQSLFPKLSDHLFNVDLIIISVEDFYKIDNIDVFDIVNTLSTLIKCTVSRQDGKVQKRNTKIVAAVNDLTDPKLIKEIMTLPNVYLGLKCSNEEDYQESKNWLSDCLAGTFKTPDKIIEILKHKKKPKINRDDIRLTPRQAQILTLITTRGASNKVIARLLHLSESTIKLHVSCILKKYGVKNRTQLVVFTTNSNT